MFYVEAAVRLKEKKTVTQEAAYWVLPSRKSSVEYAPLNKIDFTSSKTLKRKLDNFIDDGSSETSITPEKQQTSKDVYRANSDAFRSFMDKITVYKPAFHTVHPLFSSNFKPTVLQDKYPKLLTELFNENLTSLSLAEVKEHCKNIDLAVTPEQVQHLEMDTREQHHTDKWFKFRTGRISASKFRAVVSTQINNPSISLIKEICNPSHFKSSATQWGIDKEGTAKKDYLERYSKSHEDLQIEPTGFFLSQQYPFIGATPDGIVKCKCCSDK